MKTLGLFLLTFFLAASFAGAQSFDTPGGAQGFDTPGGGSGFDTPSGESAGCGESVVCLNNPLAADNILEFFETVIDIVLVFAVPLIVLFIIYAGFLYVTARGNEGTIESAHKALLYALVGGLLILGARVLIDVVQGTVDSVRESDSDFNF